MRRWEREPTTHLTNLIREHRHRAGLTQRALAEKAGISLATLRDLEQGRRSRPRPGSLTALAEALDLDPSQTAEFYSYAAAERRRAVARNPHLLGTGPQGGPHEGLWLAILGPLEAWLDGTPLLLGPPARRAVLGLLAMHQDALVRRDAVIDVLWGAAAPSTAVNLVQAHVSRLRKLLMPRARREEIISSGGGGYRLLLRTEQLDLLTFRALTANAEAARSAGDDLRAFDLYGKALGLRRGDPLADVDVLADEPGVVELRRQLTDVLLRYAELSCGLGLHDRALPRLRALAAAEPLNESVHARLMTALAGTGQQAAAMSVYEDLRHRLDREFGIYPGSELNNAHQRVLRQDIPVMKSSYGLRLAGNVVPRQLPAAARYFTGRDTQQGILSDLLIRASPEAGGVAIAALTGMAGIGKTALTVRWAHQVADRFPDGQLFVDLRGFCPSGSPLEPAEALRGFLLGLGVSSARIPAHSSDRAALYRSLLASRRVLVVLDNAQDAKQVRPLLPGSPGCLVLVTSRHRLTGLAAADGAHLIPLGGLNQAESYSLLARILGTERVAAETAAIDELITLCARLPLALRNAAARVSARPRLPLATLVAEMKDERGRLDALETGEPATSVRVVFSLSHATLSGLASEMFQMLGTHQGPEITVPAAAALTGSDRMRAQAALSELCDEHLLTEHTPGRYRCHELLRAYAAEDVCMHVPEAQRRAAVYRMLDYYLHTTSAISTMVNAHLAPRALNPPRPGVFPERISDLRQAMQWAEDERFVLLALIEQAAEEAYHPHAWELPWSACWLFSDVEGWGRLAKAQEAALEIAGRLADPGGAALAHHHLSWLRFRLGDIAEAYRHLDDFIEMAARLCGRQSHMLTELGTRGARSWGNLPEALVRAGRLLGLYRAESDRGLCPRLVLRFHGHKLRPAPDRSSA